MGLEKVLYFLATTKNTSVTKILLVLNPKHSSYWRKMNSVPTETRTKVFLDAHQKKNT